MKTRTKIMIPTVAILIIGSFFIYITANGFSFYNEGLRVDRFSANELEKELKADYMQDVQIQTITDNDLKDVPKLKELIDKSLTKEFPANPTGTISITYEELYNFQQQYSEILAEKYSKNPTDFFTANYDIREEYLAIDSAVYLRSFEGRYFEYDDKQYGIGPNKLYVPSVEDDDLLRLKVYKTNGPLREKDHTWADLSETQIDLKPLIISAINDIGQQQENIEVQNHMSSAEVDRYQKWYNQNITSNIFEYNGNYFRIGFWVA
ncbi:MAG: hypothetical protein IIC67_00565 [Thaumarchaeota archaeon]|nr:hypothetical protein [Nitrososphaerota archaeon]